MGGSGSTRWGWHSTKTQVENCLKIDIFSLKKFLISGNSGMIRWHVRNQETGRIGYTVKGLNEPSAIRLYYTITPRSGDKIDIDFEVKLTKSTLSWGGERYWFLCPLQNCNRRVGCLYLPPGGRYFGCRHCYELTYRSSQESHMSDGLFMRLAASMQDEYPGMSWKDVKAALDGRGRYIPQRFYWTPDDIKADRFANYLTRDELCEKSGLSSKNLAQLEEARLLLPDRDERYRPKLVSWGQKLAYLLNNGWENTDIRAWANGRWKTSNPRQWPPILKEWRLQNE